MNGKTKQSLLAFLVMVLAMTSCGDTDDEQDAVVDLSVDDDGTPFPTLSPAVQQALQQRFGQAVPASSVACLEHEPEVSGEELIGIKCARWHYVTSADRILRLDCQICPDLLNTGISTDDYFERYNIEVGPENTWFDLEDTTSWHHEPERVQFVHDFLEADENLLESIPVDARMRYASQFDAAAELLDAGSDSAKGLRQLARLLC